MSRKFLIDIDIEIANAASTSDAFAFAFVKANRYLGNSLSDIAFTTANATSDIRRKRESRFVKANRFTRGLEAGLGTSRNFTSAHRNFADPL